MVIPTFEQQPDLIDSIRHLLPHRVRDACQRTPASTLVSVNMYKTLGQQSDHLTTVERQHAQIEHSDGRIR